MTDDVRSTYGPPEGSAKAYPGARRRPAAKPVNLALQGGGAHGAYTWGVLDRLLEDERIVIEGISGTSAGAMNAAALAYGHMNAGAAGARERLGAFWRAISESGKRSWLRRTPLDRMARSWNLDWSPAFLAFDTLTRLFSPYQWNPFDANPLRDVLEANIDFAQLPHCTEIKLFVSATNVRSGNIRIFKTPEIGADTLLASACLPLLFKAVEIEGEHYWDGGYMGNPAIYPLIYNCASPDILIVGVNPIRRDTLPIGATEILNREHEISFNSSLLRELRAIEFVTRLIDDGALDSTAYKRLNMHYIEAGPALCELGTSSKFNTEWAFLEHLFEDGRAVADTWLAENFEAIGNRSSVDLRREFL